MVLSLVPNGSGSEGNGGREWGHGNQDDVDESAMDLVQADAPAVSAESEVDAEHAALDPVTENEPGRERSPGERDSKGTVHDVVAKDADVDGFADDIGDDRDAEPVPQDEPVEARDRVAVHPSVAPIDHDAGAGHPAGLVIAQAIDGVLEDVDAGRVTHGRRDLHAEVGAVDSSNHVLRRRSWARGC